MKIIFCIFGYKPQSKNGNWSGNKSIKYSKRKSISKSIASVDKDSPSQLIFVNKKKVVAKIAMKT